MLKIIVASDNIYYRKGVESLIMSAGKTLRNGLFEVYSETSNLITKEADIVFRDIMISIFFYTRETISGKGQTEYYQTALHIPFICRGDNIPQITGKIRKIMLIASTNAANFTSRENYKITGLKEFMQLSSTESKVMLMVGQGYDTENISRMLGRSKKTVSTHCRNAIRKMGMLNRVEFYKYASFVAKAGNKKGNTLCL
ncbi:helix-turn-helix transcriptional regulator [Erwinia sp. 198]|uniref:helix-turn-helix domain-containing protein n=1 Tax=Erwinia sp. 198 TaxID=2022746 RepID=UPI000F67E4DB|nr:helix-turn-helix transcriptional regulator [Erwinia sp. 198]RRZ91667.1 LuxR family transcriptional regulator [Erwinia sp. 198]